MISFDLETFPITNTIIAPKPVVASFCSGDEPYLIKFPDAVDTIKRMLDSSDTICGANIAYDMCVLSVHYPSLIPLIEKAYTHGRVFDVQIAAFLDHVASGRTPTDEMPILVGNKKFKRFSLEACVAVYLGRFDAKENAAYRLRYGELSELPLSKWPEVAVQYPKDDAKNTYDCALKISNIGHNLGDIENKTFTHQTLHARAAYVMQLGAAYGMCTDAPYIDKLQQDILDRYNAEREEWKKEGLVRPDGKDNDFEIKRRVIRAYSRVLPENCFLCHGDGKVASSKTGKPVQCKACGGTGWEVPRGVPRTPAGGIGKDQDTLQQSGDRTLEDFYNTNKKKKPLTTYIPLLKNDGAYSVHIQPNALVETGRSSYKGAIQQIPRSGGIREAFIPGPGNLFCSVDYTALELCSLSQITLWLFGESVMADLINRDIDLHSFFGAALMNISLDEFLVRRKQKDKTVDAYRFGAKAVNFGLPGGMGVAKFVFTQRKNGVRFCELFGQSGKCGEIKVHEYMQRAIPPTCTVCLDVVAQLKAKWLATFPEIPKYLAWIKQHGDALKLNAGILRVVGTGYVRGGLGFTDMANTSFQHLAALGAKHALWNVWRETVDSKSSLHKSHILLFLHDEIFLEIPEANASEAAFKVGAIMEASMSEFIPDVKIKAPPALMRRWYKGADTVLQDGKLVPWEPVDTKP